jgi:zinc transport system substrate-binding protein
MALLLFASAVPILADNSTDAKTAVQKPLIITTIKPLAIIAKSAVGENAKVEYLQSAAQSAHEVTLPVSAMIKVEQAELVIWIGEGFEGRIGKSMALLPESRRITVMDLELLPAESKDEQESDISSQADKAKDSHDHHDHLQFDPHIWLNPTNGNILANSIQLRLGLPQSAIISPELIGQLKAELEPVKDKNYLTHHDAFAHFATAFDLSRGLSIRDASGASQGARSQYQLRQKTKELNASCIFIEPQYADKDAKIIAKQLQLPLKTLDSQGFDQPLSADGYSAFMFGLVAQFKACFE